eukprot:247451-Hanusia_phi.AAC.1
MFRLRNTVMRPLEIHIACPKPKTVRTWAEGAEGKEAGEGRGEGRRERYKEKEGEGMKKKKSGEEGGERVKGAGGDRCD